MVSIVYEKKFERIQYLREQQIFLEIERDKLKHKRFFSLSPSISSSNGKSFTSGLIGQLNINEFIFDFDLNDHENSTTGLMLPLLNTKKKKIRINEEIIDLTIKKSSIEIEMTVFTELQNLLLSLLELKKINDEIKLRDSLSLRAEKIISILFQLYKSGIIPERALTSTTFFRDNNNLSTDMLRRRVAINENRIMDEYLISSEQVSFCLSGLNEIISSLTSNGEKSYVDMSTYDEQIAILDREINRKNVILLSASEYYLSAGPKLDINNNFSNYVPGAGITFAIELFPQKQSKKSAPVKDIDVVKRFKYKNSELAEIVRKHINYADTMIQNCIKEISLGNTNSMYSLTDYLNEILSQQISRSLLADDEFQTLILSYRKMDDFKIIDIYKSIVEN